MLLKTIFISKTSYCCHCCCSCWILLLSMRGNYVIQIGVMWREGGGAKSLSEGEGFGHRWQRTIPWQGVEKKSPSYIKLQLLKSTSKWGKIKRWWGFRSGKLEKKWVSVSGVVGLYAKSFSCQTQLCLRFRLFRGWVWVMTIIFF